MFLEIYKPILDIINLALENLGTDTTFLAEINLINSPILCTNKHRNLCNQCGGHLFDKGMRA